MREMLEHQVYKQIKRLEGIVLDYVILEGDNNYIGEESHKRAAIEAMKIIAKRCDNWAFDKMKNDLNYAKLTRKNSPTINIYENKIQGKLYSTDQFFAIPEDVYYIDKYGESWSYLFSLGW